jgi:hypothetical protein
LTSYNTLAYFGPTEKSLRRLPPAADRDLVDIGVDAGAGPVGQFFKNFFIYQLVFFRFWRKRIDFQSVELNVTGSQ